jgi:acyl-CoA thioesterase
MPNELKAIKDHFANDRFAATNGIRLLDVQPGWARASMDIEDRHLNSVEVVQGGAIFTLADSAFAAACNSGGRVALAVSTNLSFLRSTRSGKLVAEAIEIARSRKLSTCSVRVIDSEGELVALFQGTAYIKDEPFPPE